eukprot:6050120-Amphidinium_carterae.1
MGTVWPRSSSSPRIPLPRMDRGPVQTLPWMDRGPVQRCLGQQICRAGGGGPAPSGNTTVSSSERICYTEPMATRRNECHSDTQTAEADGSAPSMSCVVPSSQRETAISVRSGSDDDDYAPLTHLVNRADSISPVTLAMLVLFLQCPCTWLGWLPVAAVTTPLMVTKAVFRWLVRTLRRSLQWFAISVYHIPPRHRPTHRFACIRVGEASNPRPSRQKPH